MRKIEGKTGYVFDKEEVHELKLSEEEAELWWQSVKALKKRIGTGGRVMEVSGIFASDADAKRQLDLHVDQRVMMGLLHANISCKAPAPAPQTSIVV